jgi:hypothetical protein
MHMLPMTYHIERQNPHTKTESVLVEYSLKLVTCKGSALFEPGSSPWVECTDLILRSLAFTRLFWRSTCLNESIWRGWANFKV